MIWIVMAPLLVLVIFVVVGHWVTTQKIASRQSYQAVLRPQSTPVAVVLPQGAHLASISVSEGEIVRPGQTLARLDVAAADAAWVALEQKLIMARYARHCLLHQNDEPFLASVEAWLSRDRNDPEMVARIQSAHAACDAERDGADAQMQALVSALGVLKERDALLVRAIKLHRTAQDTQTAPVTREGVQLLLAQNDTRARIATSEDQIARLNAERTQIRAERLSALNIEISALLATRSHAAAMRGTSILTAETGGIVTRVRNPGAGHHAKQALTILDISRSESPTFALELVSDQMGLERLQIGLPVEVRLSWPGQTEAYEGTLVSRENLLGNGPIPGFAVELTEAAQRALQDATGSLAISGTATTAKASVSVGLLPASQVLNRVAQDLWRTSYAARVSVQSGRKTQASGAANAPAVRPDI